MVKKNGKLEDAIATLIQNQAAFVAEMREMSREKREMDREMRQINRGLARTNREMAELKRTSDERFARIESLLATLVNLPEKLKEEIAFGFAAWRKQENQP